MDSNIEYFTYKGKNIAYQFSYNDPSKKTIVFLHDSLGFITLWRNFPALCADLFDCNFLVYDRIGYGISDPMDSYVRENDYMHKEALTLNELLMHLNLEKVGLFGHSDGASIALIAAAYYPEKIEFVISEAAHVFVENITLQGIINTQNAFKNSNLPQRLAKYHGEKVDFLFKAWTEIWLDSIFSNWQIIDLLKKINCPKLIIQGSDDAYGSLEQVQTIINNSNGITFSCIIPNCDHTPHKEVPEVVLQALQLFKSFYLESNT